MLAFSSCLHFLWPSLISFCFIFHDFLLPLHFSPICSCRWWKCPLLSFSVSLADLFQNNPALASATIIPLCSASAPYPLQPSRPPCLDHKVSEANVSYRFAEEDQRARCTAAPGTGQGKRGCEMRVRLLSPSLLARRCHWTQRLMFGVVSGSFIFFLSCSESSSFWGRKHLASKLKT